MALCTAAFDCFDYAWEDSLSGKQSFARFHISIPKSSWRYHSFRKGGGIIPWDFAGGITWLRAETLLGTVVLISFHLNQDRLWKFNLLCQKKIPAPFKSPPISWPPCLSCSYGSPIWTRSYSLHKSECSTYPVPFYPWRLALSIL